MPDKETVGQMGDIIGTTRERLDASKGGGDRLRGLVPPRDASPKPKAADIASPAEGRGLPTNYFPQVAEETGVKPKRRPQRGPTRSVHISMRLAPAERDRFVAWCEDKNLSLADGLNELLDSAERS
ncbi:hypothetical protein [Sphingomonas sp. VNH70]|uniref:hypothetical protein n=1 Tax=Sphingomonas silueang TaxID=3156617 RepID=UPI0032B52A5D